MRKLALIGFALISFALAGCKEEGQDLTRDQRTMTICLGGVEYWLLNAETQSQMLAPKVDAATLTFVRCGVK